MTFASTLELNKEKCMMKTVLAAAFALAAVTAAADGTLFENGKTSWRIQLPTKAAPAETYAAMELKTALKKISGADFVIVVGDAAPKAGAIVLGSLETSPAVKAKAAELKLSPDKTERTATYALDGNLYLAGDNPRGCLYAVYDFLQRQLGARWLWPGDDGEFMPALERYALPPLARNYQPPFRFREMSPCFMHNHVPTEIWMARNFLNCGSNTPSVRDQAGFHHNVGGHSVSLRKDEFGTRPELFSQINGRRVPEGEAGCWANPEFLKHMVEKHSKLVEDRKAELLNAFPADITLRCECDSCVKDPDPSSRWYDFYYKLAQELKKRHPGLEFAGIAYQEYRAVPAAKVKGLEYVEYCQYNRCYVHKLGDAGCQINRRSVDELKRWGTKAPMGIYGYEFDVFAPCQYVPFWNMLDDEIKTCRDMGIVRMKTEMPVSYPQGARRHELPPQILRLPHYLYAQLLWNPDAKVDGLLADWCQTVYGPASPYMLEYHKAMAASWDALKIHLSYFNNNPVGAARHFLNPELIEKAEGLLKRAAAAAAGVADQRRRARVEADLDLDRKLFQEWRKLYQVARENAVAISLPFQKDANAFDKAVNLPFQSKGGKHKPTEAWMYWTPDALRLRLLCHDPEIVALKRGVQGCDVNLWGGDHFELFIDRGDGEAYRHLALNPAGGLYDAKGGDSSWNPAWQVKTEVGPDAWTADIAIPFSELGGRPETGDQWQIVVNRNSAPEACGFPFPSYHDTASGAVIYFCDKAAPDRRLNWVLPEDENRDGYIPALLRDGWNFQFIKGAKAMAADLGDNGMTIVTTHSNKAPLEFYKKKLAAAVRNGAVAVFDNYGSLPCGEYFDDGSFALRFTDAALDPLRKTIGVTNSPFAAKPHDMKEILGHTPPGVYIPAAPTEWEFLATQLMTDGSERPYLLARPYGKGMVVVAGLIGYAKSPERVAQVLDNLLEHNKNIKRARQTTL